MIIYIRCYIHIHISWLNDVLYCAAYLQSRARNHACSRTQNEVLFASLPSAASMFACACVEKDLVYHGMYNAHKHWAPQQAKIDAHKAAPGCIISIIVVSFRI